MSTAIAGELFGNKLIYLEAGSGAKYPVHSQTISLVKRNLNIPIIVGGGLRSADDIRKTLNAGADIVVIGNSLEKTPDVLFSLVNEVRSFKADV